MWTFLESGGANSVQAAMSLQLLKRLGEAALKPRLVDGIWRKAPISAKNAARLRKESLLATG